MKITREELRRWGACYNDQKIAELVPEEGLTPLEIAALDIPVSDRLWVLLREEVIPSRDLRLLSCDWAEAACHAAGWNDERSLNAITVARRFACGEATEAELAESESAARAASGSAASAASAWAAWSAVAVSAEAVVSAWSAAASSAEASAASAEASEASVAAWAVARAEQLTDVVKVLKG